MNLSSLLCVLLSLPFLIRERVSKILFAFLAVLNIAVAGHALVESVETEMGYKNSLAVVTRNMVNTSAEVISPIFRISRTGSNVFCIMLDRATGAYLEECFREDPTLYEQYDGFTFFPNTVSFSYGTVAGSPGLFGGYEYVPAVMNLKNSTAMSEKFEEAMSLLPRLFAQAGFSATVTDLPLANYVDDFFYMDSYHEGIRTLSTINSYKDRWKREHGFGADIQLGIDRKRFLPYSIIRVCPVSLRHKLYEEGSYLISYYDLDEAEVNNSLYFKEESMENTINNYSVLDYLPQLTEISEAGDNFVFMVNNLTHSPNVLKVPEYIPSPSITDESPSRYAADAHYYVNMAALKLLGKWLDYLKENSAYDNTRIIISADHGGGSMVRQVEGYSALPRAELECLLLVKDFNARGKLITDCAFMTNADVPGIAVAAVIDSPVNPATGNDITKLSLKSPVYGEYTEGGKALRNKRNTAFSVDEGTWYSVHDDIFTAENWSYPSSQEVYAETRRSLELQEIYLSGGGE